MTNRQMAIILQSVFTSKTRIMSRFLITLLSAVVLSVSTFAQQDLQTVFLKNGCIIKG